MDEKTSESLYRNDLLFFGTITANVTHELNNVLSIINEYSGLLDDMLIAAEKGKPVDTCRVQQIAQNIGEQIKREKRIIKLLNRFAHRVDKPVVKFNLNDLVKDIVRLSQRFASLKKIELGVTVPEEEISLTNDPFAIQHTIFLCLKVALYYSDIGDNIHTELEKNDRQALIKIDSPSGEKDQDVEEMVHFISILLKNLGGETETVKTNKRRQIQQISFPLHEEENITEDQEELINGH